jgi:pimeloyl-ACP methyl ester carboxylesterase
MTAAREAFEDIRFTTRDGLTLYARCYPAADGPSPRRPVLCLPGLTRNGRDFHELALALSAAGDGPRDVFTLDFRGRGLSDSDKDWKNYAVPVETLDVLDFIAREELSGCGIVGTSRGGLVAMVMAATQPTTLGPVVMNDIGPVIEWKGLARISAYAGRIPLPGSWREAAKLVRDMSVRAFPAVPEADWEPIARQWFNERNGLPAPGYDNEIARSLSVLDGPMPELWAQYEAMRHVPVLVLRGENSDILSEKTMTEMVRRHPDAAALTVPGQGHAPMLRDHVTNDAIKGFFASTDRAARARKAA